MGTEINVHSMITEEFLQFLWRSRTLQMPLKTVYGDPVTVIHPGVQNKDGGPDFINARIEIGGMVWAGNVEVHLRASDWYRHLHHHDPAYQNVILHVVDTFDKEVVGSGHQPIPVIEVRGHYPPRLSDRYQHLQDATHWIPCQNLLPEVDGSVFPLWAPGLVVERLARKSSTLKMWLDHAENQWDELGHQVLSSAMGSRINAQPFELLARSLPLKILMRHRDRLPEIEAMLFGQAGMLNPAFRDEYPRELLRTYRFFRDKYSLKPADKIPWKFLRIRPFSFPTIRISQYADLISRHGGIREILLEDLPATALTDLLHASASPYWNDHYMFDRQTASVVKRLGCWSVNLLIINAIVPYMFFYGSEKGVNHSIERAVSLLEGIPGESNSLINTWSGLGLPTNHALFTQALHQLKNEYCDRKRCLECRIGGKLLR